MLASSYVPGAPNIAGLYRRVGTEFSVSVGGGLVGPDQPFSRIELINDALSAQLHTTPDIVIGGYDGNRVHVGFYAEQMSNPQTGSKRGGICSPNGKRIWISMFDILGRAASIRAHGGTHKQASQAVSRMASIRLAHELQHSGEALAGPEVPFEEECRQHYEREALRRERLVPRATDALHTARNRLIACGLVNGRPNPSLLREHRRRPWERRAFAAEDQYERALKLGAASLLVECELHQ